MLRAWGITITENLNVNGSPRNRDKDNEMVFYGNAQRGSSCFSNVTTVGIPRFAGFHAAVLDFALLKNWSSVFSSADQSFRPK